MAKATFFDAMQSLGGAGANVASGMDKELREKAHSDLLYMQADYRQAETDFLNDLAQSNEYSPDFYKKKLSDFENEWRTKFQQQSRNGYTSREADKMFIQNQPQLYAKVQAQYRQRENAHYLQQDMETIDKNNSTLPGTERLDANNEVIENSFRAGRINEAQKAQLQQENYAGVLYDTEKANASRIMKNAVANGRSLDEALKMFDENYSANDIFKDYQGPGLENFTDKERKSIIDKVKTAAKEEYNTELKARQQQTDDTLTAIFEKVKSTADPEMQELYKKQGRDAMKAIERNTPLYIGQDQRVTWATRFAPDKLPNGGDGTGKQGKVFIEAKNIWDQLRVPKFQNGKAGEFGGAKNAYAMRDHYFNNDLDKLAEMNGLNFYEKADLKQNMNIYVTDKMENDFKKVPAFASLYSQLGADCKRLNPKDSVAAKEFQDQATDILTDLIAEYADPSNPESYKGLVEKATNMVMAARGNYWAGINQGKGETSKFIADYFEKDGVTAKDPKKMLAAGTFALAGGNAKEYGKDAKLVYTDTTGNLRPLSPYAQGAVDAMNPYVNDLIKAMTGDDTDLEGQWEDNGAYDLTGQRIYRRGGEAYKLVSDNGKDIELYKVTGDKLELVADKKKINDYFFDKHDRPAMEDKAERENNKVKKQEAQEETEWQNRMEKERRQDNAVMEQNGVTEEEFYGMSRSEYEALEKAWDKMSKKEKKQYKGDIGNYVQEYMDNMRRLNKR